MRAATPAVYRSEGWTTWERQARRTRRYQPWSIGSWPRPRRSGTTSRLTDAPTWLPTYSSAEQALRGKALGAFLETFSAELAQQPTDSQERQATQARILAAFEAFARTGLGWRERHVELLLGGGLVEVGADFCQRARRFDDQVSGREIFQASRNVWTMNGLQILMGIPPSLTPSIFAYSMLYPYTDNYLDDPDIPMAAKQGFSQRFSVRLAGDEAAPANDHEAKIWRLVVGMIEEQYDRRRDAQVYDGLAAIHTAQEKSLRLLRRASSGGMGAPHEVDVLGISLEKGGTSVLADGYLVAGDLTLGQASFLFGYGAYLQLLDDLQDIEPDRTAGLMTVYTQSAYGAWRLDGLADRALCFGARVMEGLAGLGSEAAEPLRELMRDSLSMLLVDAVGAAPRHFSRGYVRGMGRHSPFRFGFLKRVRRRLARERVSLMGMIEAFASKDA